MVKYKFDPDAPIIVLSARLSNSQTRWITMALDTGATYTMIPWDIAEALEYEPTFSRQKIDMTNLKRMEMGMAF